RTALLPIRYLWIRRRGISDCARAIRRHASVSSRGITRRSAHADCQTAVSGTSRRPRPSRRPRRGASHLPCGRRRIIRFVMDPYQFPLARRIVGWSQAGLGGSLLLRLCIFQALYTVLGPIHIGGFFADQADLELDFWAPRMVSMLANNDCERNAI